MATIDGCVCRLKNQEDHEKNIFLLAIASFGIFAFLGCQNAGERVFTVGELVDKVTADKDGWTGKEVIVSGFVSYASGSAGANDYVLNMVDDRDDESERHVTCKVSQRDLPEGIKGKTIKVKGKIGSAHTQSYLNLKNVTLDSCEIKK